MGFQSSKRANLCSFRRNLVMATFRKSCSLEQNIKVIAKRSIIFSGRKFIACHAITVALRCYQVQGWTFVYLDILQSKISRRIRNKRGKSGRTFEWHFYVAWLLRGSTNQHLQWIHSMKWNHLTRLCENKCSSNYSIMIKICEQSKVLHNSALLGPPDWSVCSTHSPIIANNVVSSLSSHWVAMHTH